MIHAIEAYFYREQDSHYALYMQSYMRNQFLFLGIPAPVRKRFQKEFFSPLKKETSVNWSFIESLFQKQYREFHYCAVDYLSMQHRLIEHNEYIQIKQTILSKSWWDTVDNLAVLVGRILYQKNNAEDIMLSWSQDENMWIRRVSVLHQLRYKEQTNTDLLKTIILNNREDNDFFIQKAIGWALREYSKCNAQWVFNFLKKYSGQLSALSIREAQKYMLKKGIINTRT